MKNRDRFFRKSYAMQRMAVAIQRAIEDPTDKEKERAARWAAAWGLLCGIRTEGVRLRGSDVQQNIEDRIRRPSDQIEISALPAPPQGARGVGLCESPSAQGGHK
jgi:hypothetical protein